MIAVSFGEKPAKILLYMSVSMAFWAGAFALLGNQLLDYIPW